MLASNNNNNRRGQDNSQQHYSNLLLTTLAVGLASAASILTSSCDDSISSTTKPKNAHPHDHLTPSDVAKEDFEELIASHNIDEMPVYTSDQVAENDGTDGKPIWMSYGGVVYDVTDFIPNHPGGTDKIITAAGSAIEPFWHTYRQHYASDLPTRLMEHMAIGRLEEKDQEEIDDQMSILQEEDPYANEPVETRDRRLIVHSDQPFKAEAPALRAEFSEFLTPNSIFYVRNHHPVPHITEADVESGKFHLQIDLTEYGKGTMGLTMDDIKQMPKEEVVATLQCAGNRRGEFNTIERTSGAAWGQGAISTAKWGGVRLSEVLKKAGIDVSDPITIQDKDQMNHVHFHGIDGMHTSIGTEKALNPYGDCFLCYEMNGQPLAPDHGYPLRVVVPGYVAVRSVKWLNKITLSKMEAESPWNRGLNYKVLSPSLTDAKNIDLDTIPSMSEGAVFSGITMLKPKKRARTTKQKRISKKVINNNESIGSEGKTSQDSTIKKKSTLTGTRRKRIVPVKAKGWAWAGGGRSISRVDITGDGGKTWVSANIVEGNNQKPGRAWAWVQWECDNIPCTIRDGCVAVQSKAVDSAANVQPEQCRHLWNVRGLSNSTWYKKKAKVRRKNTSTKTKKENE